MKSESRCQSPQLELTRLAGKATAGIFNDVVLLGGYQEAEIDLSSTIQALRSSTATRNCPWISAS